MGWSREARLEGGEHFDFRESAFACLLLGFRTSPPDKYGERALRGLLEPGRIQWTHFFSVNPIGIVTQACVKGLMVLWRGLLF